MMKRPASQVKSTSQMMERPASQVKRTSHIMKRPAGQMEPTTRPMKRPAGMPEGKQRFVLTPKTEPEPNVELAVILPSGRILGRVSASATWTGAEVKSALCGFLEEGQAIDQLCFDSKVFGDGQTAKELGLLGQSTPIVLTAVLAPLRPCLHLFNHCSAMELSERHDRWKVAGGPSSYWTGPDGEGNFCSPEVHHLSMDSAPALAQEVAEEIRAKFADGGLPLVTIGNNYKTTDEVIVVSNPGGSPEEWPKEGILRALGVRREDLRFAEEMNEPIELDSMIEPGSGFNVWRKAEMHARDWSTDLIGLSHKRKNFREGDTELAKIIAITDVMAKRLTRHFQFSMSLRVECMKAPIIRGGFTSDGHIVGVLDTFLNR